MGAAAGQHSRSLFRGSIGTRLLAVNLILWLGLAGIGLVVFLSFGRVRTLVNTSLTVNLRQVLDNARTARTLSQVLADANLLVGTFYGRQSFLEQEGNRLLAMLAEADARTTSAAMQSALTHISAALAEMLEQCRAVNDGLAALTDSDAAIHDDLLRLEKLVSNQLIDQVQAGEAVSHLEQLAALIAGYRESMLIIRGQVQALRPDTLSAAEEGGEARGMEALRDLCLRVRTLSASQADIAAAGQTLGANLADYTRRYAQYSLDMGRLKTVLADFDAVRAEVMARLAEADAATSQAEGVLRREIDSSVTQTKTAVALLGLVVLAVLAALTSVFLVTTIHRPVREILRVLTAYRQGDLSARMELERSDEWALIQGSLNTMAAELQALMQARDAAENALRLSEEKYRGIFENAQEGIFRSTEDGRFESANPAMARMLGYDSPEALKAGVRSIAREVHVDPGTRKRLLAELKARGAVKNFLIRTRRRDGRIIVMSMTARLIREEAGAVRIEGLAADVTERVRYEEELKAAKETAEQATAAKSIFLAKMSHELRTPLSGILGLTELSLESTPPPELAKYLGGIRQSAQDLLTLINDLLDFSKIEAGRFELEMMDFDLPATVEAAVSGLAYQARRKGLAIGSSIAPGTPAHLVGDPYRLRRILVNLLGNAVKFTEQGRVHLAVAPAGPEEAEPSGPAEIVLAFTVSDTGIGIPADKQAVIFDSFTQAEGSQTRKYGGTGLGLAICRELTAMMGGRIRLVSEPGKGSTFAFTARFGLAEGAAEGADRTGAETPEPVLALSVLLAEDNAVNRLYATDALAKWGFAVQAVTDGREVLHALSSQPFDLVLMDVEMPGLDGLEATRLIRAERERFDPAVPIIALTAHVQPGDRERFLAAGMNGYVSKPLTRDELTRAIREVMAGRRPAQAAPEPAGAAPVLDAAGALARMQGERGLYAELLELYLRHLSEFLENLQRGAGSSAGLEPAVALRLAGASATVGALAMQQAAAALAAGPSGDARKDARAIEEITELAEATGEAAAKLLAELRAAPPETAD